MAKLWNYVILMTILILLTRISGFDTGASTSFGQLGNINFTNASDPTCPNCITGVDLSGSSIWDYLFDTETGILAIVATTVGLIAASLFARGKGENFILLPFCTIILTLFGQTFWSIITYALSTGVIWASMIVSLIFIPLGVGFVISCVEFFRGTD